MIQRLRCANTSIWASQHLNSQKTINRATELDCRKDLSVGPHVVFGGRQEAYAPNVVEFEFSSEDQAVDETRTNATVDECRDRFISLGNQLQDVGIELSLPVIIRSIDPNELIIPLWN